MTFHLDDNLIQINYLVSQKLRNLNSFYFIYLIFYWLL